MNRWRAIFFSALVATTLYADGLLKSSALATVQVVESIRVENSVREVNFSESAQDDGQVVGIEFALETSFGGVPFLVWMTIPAAETGKQENRVHATFKGIKIPIEVRLESAGGGFKTSVNPASGADYSQFQAQLNARPGVKKTEFKLKCMLPASYNLIESRYPPGNYRAQITTNISQND